MNRLLLTRVTNISDTVASLASILISQKKIHPIKPGKIFSSTPLLNAMIYL